MEGTIGEIRMFAGNFAPRSWALCEGQLIAISQNTALFSIIGTIFGGDGRTTFALPDLRGRVAIQPGSGPGLSPYALGQRGGTEKVTLQTNQIPSHTHPVSNTLGVKIGTIEDDGNTEDVAGHILANSPSGNLYSNSTADTQLGGVELTGSVAVGNTGGTGSHTNIQPYLGVNHIICLFGIFPSRS